MKSAGVAALKSRLTAYLRLVKGGHEVVVTERGRPIAKLVPLSASESQDERLDRLVAAGLIRRGKGPLPERFWKEPPEVKDPEGHLLRALLEDRDSGP